jgi:hypothetical protein
MWEAIQASGRPMVLTVEGDPDDGLITKGGYGNAKRVGHDIQPYWMSMVSLVDIGSGLWVYAHNSTNATFGGWWNGRGACVCWVYKAQRNAVSVVRPGHVGDRKFTRFQLRQ